MIASTDVKAPNGRGSGNSSIQAVGQVEVSNSSPAASYVATVLSSHPSFFWQLDQRSGSVADDATPNKFEGIYEPGTVLGVPGPIAGEGSTATLFDGTDGYVTASKDVPAAKLYSIEAWFKTTTITGGLLVGFGDKQTGPSTLLATNLYMTNDGQIVFGTWTGRAQAIETPHVYNDGHWHFVVATMSSSGMRLYVDGQLVGTDAATAVETFKGYWRVAATT